jgi:hypothetical protein
VDFEEFKPFGGGIDGELILQHGENPRHMHAWVQTMKGTIVRCWLNIVQVDAEIDVRSNGQVVKAQILNER